MANIIAGSFTKESIMPEGILRTGRLDGSTEEQPLWRKPSSQARALEILESSAKLYFLIPDRYEKRGDP